MMNKRGKLFIISGASATGKDTIIGSVVKAHPNEAVLSVSMTTRSPRCGETDGVDYFFVSEEKFEENIRNDKMLEYAKYGSNYYGTPVEPVEKWLNEGKIVFLVIEVKGAAIVRERCPEAKSVFVLPPSMDILERRLRLRGTEDEEAMKCRLEIAKDEILRAEEYDYIIVNDELKDAVSDIVTICKYEQHCENCDKDAAEKLKKQNMMNIVSEVMNK